MGLRVGCRGACGKKDVSLSKTHEEGGVWHGGRSTRRASVAWRRVAARSPRVRRRQSSASASRRSGDGRTRVGSPLIARSGDTVGSIWTSSGSGSTTTAPTEAELRRATTRYVRVVTGALESGNPGAFAGRAEIAGFRGGLQGESG